MDAADVPTENSASAAIASQLDKAGFEFNKDWLKGAVINGATGGGQMAAKLQLSPPAAETASTGSQPEQGTSSSTPSDIALDGGESIWDQAIEQAFQEALAIYPPCGRRKIIISDEGKMYGRNELIARYIKLRCGKTRTRKQVSSHIQVLARKKAREEQTKHKTENGLLPDTILPLTPKPRINGIQVPSSSPGHLPFDQTHLSASLSPTVAALSAASATSLVAASQLHADAVAKDHLATQQLINKLQSTNPGILPAMCNPIWATNLQLPFQITSAVQDIKPPVTSLSCNTEFSNSRCIMSSDIELISFTAYVENAENGNRVNLVNIPGNPEDMENIKIDSIYEKYPNSLRELFQKCPKDRFYLAKCWANIEFEGDPKSLTYAVDSYYKSMKKFDIRVATQVCSFGTKAVEKIESFKPVNYNALVGPYTYNLENSSMCEYMTKFISELKKLQFQEWMNNVLENFTVLQIVSNKDTDETLLVMCFLFEVSEDQEANYSVFRLIE